MREIQIIGGGIAGLTLGIALRQDGLPVTVHEAGAYPRHKVCGEFVSGRAHEVAATLGIWERFRSAGAVEARTALLQSDSGAVTRVELPQPALCLSRFKLDALLADEFIRIGGTLLTCKRTTAPDGEHGSIRASGRRLDPRHERAEWFGIKAHCTGFPLLADLEMHFSATGYVGLCRVEDGLVNVCALLRRGKQRADTSATPLERLRSAGGALLEARLESVEWIEDSICSVAGLSYDRVPCWSRTEFRIGDAMATMPPFTGNGMSVAFESAFLARPIAVRYATGEIEWSEALRLHAGSTRNHFKGRFRSATVIHHALQSATMRSAVARVASAFPTSVRHLFRLTR